MKHSPLFIEIALHYHYSPGPWPGELMHDAQRNIHNELLGRGMIERGPDGQWRAVDEPLRLYAEALCNVPTPVHKWIMPAPEKPC